MLLQNREPRITIINVSLISEGWPKSAVVLAWDLSYGCSQMLAGGYSHLKALQSIPSKLVVIGCWLSAEAVKLEHLHIASPSGLCFSQNKTEFQVGNSENKCSTMQYAEPASQWRGWNWQSVFPVVFYGNTVLGIPREVLGPTQIQRLRKQTPLLKDRA